MYLKEIRTHGFKSFADKTVIELGKNINGIVGPNGSGKSNIVDAVRWVLGEQSMKSLRGDSSSDVIFAGSESRKALGSASVTLVFDNEDRTLPLDFNEVSIKRIAFRTGESEYYINNERVRLKDVTELLTESGAAKESFNIIGQGKIDEILSTKAEDRRIIFEEAAGVLKYKRRKEEALRKLDKTNLNLNRVGDIIGEITNTIEPLKIESEKAIKYSEIKDKLSNLEIASIALNISNLNYEYQEGKKRIEELENEITSFNTTSSSRDIDVLKYKEDLNKVREEISYYQNKILTLSKEEERTSGDIKLFQERNKYKSEAGLIANNIISLKEKIIDINTDIDKLNNDISVLEKEGSVLEDKYNNLISAHNENTKVKDNYNNLLLKNKRIIDENKYKANFLENSINNNSMLPKPVKMILDNPKFTGIHNVISSLIDVDSMYSTAINTALGGAGFYLVVDDATTAKGLIRYLKDNSLGRATFYPLSVIAPRSIDYTTLNILRGLDGFIGSASSLVKYKPIYKDIIENTLGNVVIARDIDSANDISEKIGRKYKIVTLDGNVVNVGGSLTGGSQVKNNNTLSMKYELDSITKDINRLEEGNTNILKELDSVLKKDNLINNDIYSIQTKKGDIISRIDGIKNSLNNKISEKSKLDRELEDLVGISSNSTNEEDKLLDNLKSIRTSLGEANQKLELLKVDERRLNDTIASLEEEGRSSSAYINKKTREVNNLNININRIDVRLDNLLNTLSSEYNMTYDFAINNYKLDMELAEAEEMVSSLKNNLNMIGTVNLNAPEEYKKQKERYDFLIKQKNDLVEAENTLYEIIREMDAIMKKNLIDTFEQVRKEFKSVYRELFKGGEAELILTDPDNILTTGIEIKAEPPGKRLQSISLLSGGEKTFTAISLLFAILNVREVPFCIFDEVEAALDDANVLAFGKYLDKYRDKTQFIIITHKKKTMEFANMLYGITMEESGVSKMVSVKLEDIKKD